MGQVEVEKLEQPLERPDRDVVDAVVAEGETEDDGKTAKGRLYQRRDVVVVEVEIAERLEIPEGGHRRGGDAIVAKAEALEDVEVPEPSLAEVLPEVVVVQVEADDGVHGGPGLPPADLADPVIDKIR